MRNGLATAFLTVALAACGSATTAPHIAAPPAIAYFYLANYTRGCTAVATLALLAGTDTLGAVQHDTLQPYTGLAADSIRVVMAGAASITARLVGTVTWLGFGSNLIDTVNAPVVVPGSANFSPGSICQ
jgi:hypothetical protein